MGIRFYCPTGHRLHVKDFLAGKTGICPHCEARFRIPDESELPPGAPKIRPGSPAETRLVTESERLEPALTIATVPQENMSQESGSPVAATSQVAAAAQIATGTDGGRESAAAVGHASSTAPARSLREIPAAARVATVDPIEENPEAVWYVRPPSGGQYGPAKGDILRRWMQEGRVSADSLVWREGWADWQLAGPVFPALENAYTGRMATVTPREPTVPLATSTPSLATTKPASPLGKHRVARRKPIAAVVILALLVVALLVGLVIVLSVRAT